MTFIFYTQPVSILGHFPFWWVLVKADTASKTSENSFS